MLLGFSSAIDLSIQFWKSKPRDLILRSSASLVDQHTLHPSYPSLDECETWRASERCFAHGLAHGSRHPPDYAIDFVHMSSHARGHARPRSARRA